MSNGGNKKIRAKPRVDRGYPQAERLLSVNFPAGLVSKGNCFVPWEDFLALKKRYVRMFKKYQKAKQAYHMNKQLI
jgi:hypothetical protein